MRCWIVFGCSLFAMGLCGCKGPTRTPWDNLKETQQQNTELSLKVQSLQKENEQLRQQIQTLLQADNDTRLSELDTLAAIKLHKRTGLYDKDDNGTPETLVVYLQTIDSQQDQVKIPGRCTIQLWNLNNPAAETKLAQWNLTPKDLQSLWGGNIFALYYRIELPLENPPADRQDLTVRASFTDVLSGKTLSDQLVLDR